MNKNKFEQKYMEISWKRGGNKNYRSLDIDDSIIKFSKFLKVKGKLLDIGCGNGKNTVFFSKKGFQAKGIDFSPAAIKISKDFAKNEKSKAVFEVKDIIAEKLNEGYDIVIDSGCLHHIRKASWYKYKRNLLNVLKPKGYFYLHLFGEETGPRKGREWVVKKGHYTKFTKEKEIKQFFGKQFKILKTYDSLNPSKIFNMRTFFMQKI